MTQYHLESRAPLNTSGDAVVSSLIEYVEIQTRIRRENLELIKQQKRQPLPSHKRGRKQESSTHAQ